MKNKVSIALLALLAMSAPAFGGADFGTEGGGNKACLTTDLPAGIWSLVSFDDAGQPCWTKPDADATCDASATWDWQMRGTVIVEGQPRLLYRTATVEMQLWVGNGNGSCYGSTADPIFCDNPTTHYLQESETYALPANRLDLAIPFEFLIYQAAPWFSTYGDMNYFGMWLFVRPTVAAVCKSTNYSDLVYKDEAQ